eukprot:7533769-Pyramimonas_sp.AAC.1
MGASQFRAATASFGSTRRAPLPRANPATVPPAAPANACRASFAPPWPRLQSAGRRYAGCGRRQHHWRRPRSPPRTR